jgi:hypothetical protein
MVADEAHTPATDAKQDLPSLGVTCTDSRCEQNLHCFKPTSKMAETERGSCRSCGADLIEWERVHQRDPRDIDYLVEALQLELVRHEIWRVEIPTQVVERAVNPRRFSLDEMLVRNLRGSIAKPRSQNPWDGRQTPWPDSPHARIYHYGQHATATCCRGCLEYWHGIAADSPISDAELDYFGILVRRYIDERLSQR